ncbi:hypothetical protein PUN28_000924 [Cardiocondyla obscurior]|uniref:Uncharacterized protein n=1 Tax=Cardiocondyla obscurior TaxID=286306 RepID=A0AAW2H271_9HYME
MKICLFNTEGLYRVGRTTNIPINWNSTDDGIYRPRLFQVKNQCYIRKRTKRENIFFNIAVREIFCTWIVNFFFISSKRLFFKKLVRVSVESV